jgi:hypothetical protein
MDEARTPVGPATPRPVVPSFAAILLVVPLVWPARFVGPDATCFEPPEPPPLPAEVAPPPAPPPPPEDPLPRTPIAVAVWGEIALITVPVEDAG